MEVLVLPIFVGIVLVGGALLLFGFSIRNQDFDRDEELSMLPLEEDEDGNEADYVR